jgi:hypothetical protein
VLEAVAFMEVDRLREGLGLPLAAKGGVEWISKEKDRDR